MALRDRLLFWDSGMWRRGVGEMVRNGWFVEGGEVRVLWLAGTLRRSMEGPPRSL
jgi:hypothetical protein